MSNTDNPTTPDPEAAEAPAAYDRHGTLATNRLNSALCEAVGLDPAEVVGFELTVRGGALPKLQVWHAKDEVAADGWVADLGQAMASTTSVVLPGAIAGAAAMVQMPEPLIQLGDTPSPHAAELAAATVFLRMAADVLNGAGCDEETRHFITEGARELVGRFEDQVIQDINAAAQRRAGTDG